MLVWYQLIMIPAGTRIGTSYKIDTSLVLLWAKFKNMIPGTGIKLVADLGHTRIYQTGLVFHTNVDTGIDTSL